ncbi:MAG: tripartite tricarboxylate transporter substrate binding protein [Betaproteobacteria bacterium]|nr:tripartite tricarboxylate transporter substrate binding protein [Betaproteobacteria bacterium]
MRYALVPLLLAVAAASGNAFAADAYPAKPMRWVIPYPPGGPVDVVARPVAQKLTEAWGQPIVLDARPGAGTIIGSEMVAKSAPDGYTLLLTSAGHAVVPSIYSKLPFDTAKDFTPLSQFVSGPFILAVHPSVPAKTVRELIAFAKPRAGQILYASAGTGSVNHMSGELFKTMARIDIVHVPYKGGAPATIDLVGGHVAMMFHSIVGVFPYVKTGRLRALAVTTPKRSVLVPDIPNMAEAGLPGFEVETWYGALGPAGLPRDIVDKLSREFDRILKLPEMSERFHSQGVEPTGGAPEHFGARIASDIAKWAKVAKESGARAD